MATEAVSRAAGTSVRFAGGAVITMLVNIGWLMVSGVLAVSVRSTPVSVVFTVAMIAVLPIVSRFTSP